MPCQTETDRLPLLAEPTASVSQSPAFDAPTEHRLVPMLAWLAVILTLVVVPLRVLSQGYLPYDDALRHAAKVISGRDWSDIIVLQDQFKMDHSPGWHWILGQVHNLTGAGTDALVIFSVCALLIGFSLVPLAWIRRPEAWVATLLLGMVVFPFMMLRFYLARPFVFSATATVVILLLWRKSLKPSPLVLAVTTLLFGLAAWIHGSWYLFALLPTAFFLSGLYRSSFLLAGCWLGGSFLGALLTGHPIAYLWNAVKIGINCFGQHQLQRMLVTEFQPNDGSPTVVLLAVLFISIRVLSGNWTWNAVKNPTFILFALCWILAFRVTRFWEDWGLPAFSLWIALELHEHLNRHLALQSFRRLAITIGLCVAFFFCVTGDVHSRWTRLLTVEPLLESDPEMDPWLPDDGGILYSSNMRTFYLTFYKNPHAKWKYALGFEPAFMLPDDLRIYRNIQWNNYSYPAHAPWIEKMRPEDRLVITSTSPELPNLPALEWKYVARETWVGRLPRTTAAAPDPSPGAAQLKP